MPKAIDGWKVCSKCRVEKPVSEFSKCISRAGGYQYQCKACESRYSWQRRQRLKDESPTIIRETKICPQCGEEKPGSEFNKCSTNIDGLQSYCRACEKLYRQSDQGRATQKRNWLSDAHKQGVRRYKARKAGCVGSHTAAEFLALCEKHDFRCLRCGEVFAFEELSEDHIVPIGPGVSDRIDNIQPLCKSCNAKKGRRTIDFRSKVVATYD